MSRFDWWKAGDTPERFEDPDDDCDDDPDATPLADDPEDPGEHLGPKAETS